MKWLGWLIFVGVVAAIGGAVWLHGALRGIPAAVVFVKRDTLAVYIEERGKTRLKERHIISMPFDGRVAAIRWEVGQTVKTGDVLAEIVEQDRQLDLAKANAVVSRLEAALKEAEDLSLETTLQHQAELLVSSIDAMVNAAHQQQQAAAQWLDYYTKFADRVAKLAQTSAQSENERDLAIAQREVARFQLAQQSAWTQAQQSLLDAARLMPKAVSNYITRRRLQRDVVACQLQEARIEQQLAMLRASRAVITSPVDGVVLSKAKHSEQYLLAGTELMTIGDLEQLEVEADVLSSDAIYIKPGNRAEIYGLGAHGESQPHWNAHVSRVEPEAFTKISALGVEEQRAKVVLAFDDLSQVRTDVPSLGVGFEMRVKIYTISSENTLIVPRAALFRDRDNQWAVFVVDRKRARTRRVEVGLTNIEWAEVLSGLSEQDMVIVAPDSSLDEGDHIKPFVISSADHPINGQLDIQ